MNHLLEGSVRRAGSRLRVTAQLTDATSGFQLWSERFDRETGDVFAVQDEIAPGVVEELTGDRNTGDLKSTTPPRCRSGSATPGRCSSEG